MHQLELYFEEIVLFLKLVIEVIGVAIVVSTVIRRFIGMLRKDETTQVRLNHGLSLGLGFLLGGEILRSVTANNWNEIGMLGAIIALRTAMVILLHWETVNAEKHAHKDTKEKE